MHDNNISAPLDILLVSVETIKNQLNESVGFYCVQRDISVDKTPLLEKQLLIAQLEVLNKLASAMTVCRRPKEPQYAIPSEVRTLFQLSDFKHEWTIEELGELVFKEDVSDVAKKIARSVKYGSPVDIEFRMCGGDNRVRWVRCHSIRTEHDRAGELPHCWSIQDVTLYHDKMTTLNSHLELRSQQLAQVNHSLAEFANALSHDLKRPVRHVCSFADLIKEAVQTGDISAALGYVERVRDAANTMASLLDRMLSFSQVGHHELEYVDINQHELIVELMNESCAAHSRLNINWRIKGVLPPVFADRVLWRTLWLNLIDNAIKYSHVRDAIEIDFSAEQLGSMYAYRISDNGIGFNSAGAKRMFEVFQRLTSDTRFEGSGIGLAQARRIVEAHGGSISATSKNGCGATFSVLLPVLGTTSG